MKAIKDLEGVLCRPDNEVCFDGTQEDRDIAQKSIETIKRLADIVESLCEDIEDGTFDKNNNRKEYLDLLRNQLRL